MTPTRRGPEPPAAGRELGTHPTTHNLVMGLGTADDAPRTTLVILGISGRRPMSWMEQVGSKIPVVGASTRAWS